MKLLKSQKRAHRHKRIRAKIWGTKEVPRASVFRSNQHIVIQLINDDEGKTIAYANDSLIKKASVNKIDQANAVGIFLAEKAKEAGISKIIFDRAGYKYHGRVKALAEAMRQGGLLF